jgi:hypothetical protein
MCLPCFIIVLSFVLAVGAGSKPSGKRRHDQRKPQYGAIASWRQPMNWRSIFCLFGKSCAVYAILIDKATTKNWRDRFPELDRWFQENRPFVLWDDVRSCIRIDKDAQEQGRPTPRTSRIVPKLRPPWLPLVRAVNRQHDISKLWRVAHYCAARRGVVPGRALRKCNARNASI